MNKQQILFAKNEKYIVKLPKVIKHISPFELQFGMKQPLNYKCRNGEPESKGIESKAIPGYTDNVRL